MASHRSSLCVDAHIFATRLADGAEHELGGMKWIDDECDAYSKDARTRAWGHVRKKALVHAFWILVIFA